MFPPSSFRVVGVVCTYWVVSWSAIFINKYVCMCVFYFRFVYSHLNSTFSAPYFLTLIQFVAPSIALYAFFRLNSRLKLVNSFPDVMYIYI